MTSRERVLAAFRHEEPDRTPIFERIIKSPHSDALLGRPSAWTNFDFQMRLLADGAWEEMCLAHARDIVDMARLLGFDMVAVGRNGGPPAERPERLEPGVWRVGGSKAYVNESGWVRWESIAPPAPPVEPPSEEEQARAFEANYASGYQGSESDGEWRVFREVVRLLREEDLDLAIYSSCYAMPVCTLAPLQLEWLATRPEPMEAFYRWHSDLSCFLAEGCLREGAHVIGLGGDLACDRGPIISPAHYRHYIGPEIRRQAEAVHRLGGFATNTSDGDLWPMLEEFLVETGVDGFGEIDYAAGMDLRRLKQRLGERLCFLGNLDIRFTLTRGTPEECRKHMIECLEAGAGSGGHIVMTSNVVHEDVRLDNYLACLAAYRDYYGLEPLAV